MKAVLETINPWAWRTKKLGMPAVQRQNIEDKKETLSDA
jgi:hypothetical protein